MTKILKIKSTSPQPSRIKEAAEVIKKGGTVAFPTETVYGLGADALNPEAIIKVFRAKGRPSDNPLIVHISDMNMLKLVAKRPSKNTLALINEFWPGPLTIVLKRKKIVPDMVTGGLDTVAVRMPDNRIALSLIKKAGVPLVAPSANISGRPSPTKSQDVVNDLSEKVDVIIDGGKTRIGIESTVIDMTASPPKLFRPGGLPVEEIERIVGPVQRLSSLDEKSPARSPGLKYRHYAPKARMVIVDKKSELISLAESCIKDGNKVGLLVFHKDLRIEGCITRFAGSRPETIAKRLYDVLRDFDGDGVDIIISERYDGKGLKMGICDRLKRAAGQGNEKCL